MDALDLVLHPVRVRIVHAMWGGEAHTTAELCGRLPDVSKATVYRHVAALMEAGVLQLAGETRVRGGVERRYRLDQPAVVVDGRRAATLSKEDHRRAFVSAMAVLIAEFSLYLDRRDAQPMPDQVSYYQVPLSLSAADIDELGAHVLQWIRDNPADKKGKGRRRYLFSPVFFPHSEA